VGLAIVAARPGGGAALHVRTVRASLDGVGRALGDRQAFDVVVLGQVLSEIDVGAEPGERSAKHAAWLRALMDDFLAPHGSLVVVEPALRDRTRHLHRVRDAVVHEGATVFAPCLHAQACPALAREGDWCHEDLAVDLPPWLIPIARAAGLRHEGLSYSYLVLRNDGTTLAGTLAASSGAGLLRVVSERIKTKGKLEMFLCGSFRSEKEALAPARARVTRLDRDRAEPNRAWEKLERGEVAVLSPAPELGRPRIGAPGVVSVAVARESD
jgi:hypothetical protein